MNMKEARKVQAGALVRAAWMPKSKRVAIVLGKKHVAQHHRARVLGSMKEERYDLLISWLGSPGPYGPAGGVARWVQSWEVMVVSHVK